MSKPAELSSTLIMAKGTAAPAIAPIEPAKAPETKPPGDTKPRLVKPAAAPEIAALAEPAGHSYFKALTLKLDRARFVQLKKLGVDHNKTSQAILIEALDLWLTQHATE